MPHPSNQTPEAGSSRYCEIWEESDEGRGRLTGPRISPSARVQHAEVLIAHEHAAQAHLVRVVQRTAAQRQHSQRARRAAQRLRREGLQGITRVSF